MANKKIKKIESDEEIRQLIIERLKVFPAGKKLSIGSDGYFTKEQLISHVEENDEIGKKIIDAQLNYLRMLKTGALLDE